MKKVLDSNKNAAVLDNRMFLVFSPAVEKLEIVECDLEKPNQIGSALGNASTVICTIGASEKEIFDITGPCRIDYKATKNLVDAGNKSFPSLWFCFNAIYFVLGLKVENNFLFVYSVMVQQLLPK